MSSNCVSANTYYLLGISALSIALGIQIIVLPWLVIHQLALGSIWVGWTQAALLLPNLLLLMGGASADKGKSTLWLVPLLLFNSVVHAALAIVIEQYWLSIFILISYAAMLGMSNAFIQPWREYLLKNLDHQHIQQWVAKSSLCLYGGQAVGIAIASSFDTIGAKPLLFSQSILLLIAGAAFYCITRYLPRTTISAPLPHTNYLIEGINACWQIPAIRSLLLIVAFNGFFHIGVFIVSLPLIAQQLYQGSVTIYSGLQLVFVIGTITTTVVVIYRGFLDAPGKRIIFSLLYGGVILLAISAQPTLTGLFILIFCWGAVTGVSSTMGRSVIQALAPESSRGRIISIYQLALFGCAPIGALFAGYIINWLGVLAVLKISGIASLVTFTLILATRSLWEVTLDQDTEESTTNR